MAKQTLVQFIDDLDGSEAVGTIEFSLDGRDYEIDLSEANAGKLRDAVAEFVAAARRSGGSTRKPRGTTPKRSTGSSDARKWLQDNGHQVADRGRILQDLLDIYEQRNVGAQVADEVHAEEEPEEQLADEAGSSVGELDTSDDAVIAWHEAKGLKVNKKMMGLMRNRYVKAHPAAS